MNYIEAANEYGLIIRKSSLVYNETSSDITRIMEGVDIIGDNSDLISYGPIFGKEAQDMLKSELESIGLEEIDDFYGFDLLMPSWLKLGVRMA